MNPHDQGGTQCTTFDETPPSNEGGSDGAGIVTSPRSIGVEQPLAVNPPLLHVEPPEDADCLLNGVEQDAGLQARAAKTTRERWYQEIQECKDLRCMTGGFGKPSTRVVSPACETAVEFEVF